MKFLKLISVVALSAWLVPNAIQRLSGTTTRSEAVATAGHSSAAADLKLAMRKLWTDHTVWTRDYIIAAVDDKPDATAAASRLMKNQEDIGRAIAGYYGAAAGQQLTTLLKDTSQSPLT